MISIDFNQLVNLGTIVSQTDYAKMVKSSPKMELIIPKQYGMGKICTYPLVGGAGLVYMECCFNQDIEIYAESVSQECLSSTLCLKGSLSNYAVSQPPQTLVKHETLFARYVNEQPKMTSRFTAHEESCFITLQFSNEWLKSSSDNTLLEMLCEPHWQGMFHSGRASNIMLSVAHEIRNAVQSPSVQSQFLSAKAMELWSHHMCLLQHVSTNQKQTCGCLKKHDITAIHVAAQILVDEMIDPPDILTLSRRASINDNKLKKGFKQIYGTTAFNYLQQQRLKKARLLLENTHLNIIDVAEMVGFKSGSHFQKFLNSVMA